MAIKIITDSTCDLDFDFLTNNDVEVVSLKFFFENDEFIDGVSMTKKEFYTKLESIETLPTTSQPSPEEFYRVFSKHIENGDQVLGLFLSSELSGTYQSAAIAKGMLESENIILIDTKAVTLSFASLVLYAIKLRNEQKTLSEISTAIMEQIESTRLFAVVSTLKYLKMGGRLSKASATVGSLLNIKPIIAVENGLVLAKDKARGKQKAFEKLLSHIKSNPVSPDFTTVFGHSNAPELLLEFKEFLAQNGVVIENSVDCEIGVVVGVHAGPYAVGLGYITK